MGRMGGAGMQAPTTAGGTGGAGRGARGRHLGAYLVDRRPLAIPAYRRLWIASLIAAVGGSFSGLAIPTQLFTLTGSSATVGISAAISLVALVISALWGGTLADATDRRRLLLVADGCLALT